MYSQALEHTFLGDEAQSSEVGRVRVEGDECVIKSDNTFIATDV